MKALTIKDKSADASTSEKELLTALSTYTAAGKRGYRIKKFDHSSNTITYYVYDSAGKLLSVYDNKGSGGSIEQTELPVYASGRIGVYYKKANNYTYELSDHLGNVRVVMNGVKLASGAADIVQFNDYYAYGSILQSGGNNNSRFDYQGQYAERDPEAATSHFQLRDYDPVIGRWLGIDPMRQGSSPFIGMGNNPVNVTDPTGGKGDDWYQNTATGATLWQDTNSPTLTIGGQEYTDIGATIPSPSSGKHTAIIRTY